MAADVVLAVFPAASRMARAAQSLSARRWWGMGKTRLGELLLAKGHLNESALKVGLNHHQGNRIRLGESLVELGLCDERILTAELAEQHELDFIDLDRFPRHPDAIARIPA